MRCKRHITDGSSRVGVCASCLRERLFVLVETQSRSPALHQQINHEDHRKSDPINNYQSNQPHQHQPPPLIHNSRFYSTSQLGRNAHTNHNDTANTDTSSCSTTTHKKRNRFRILSNLFRSSNRSAVVVVDEKQRPEPQIPDPPSTRASLSASSPIPPSTWYSSLIRRKTTQESPCRSTTTTNHRRPGHHHHRNKGLSPNYTEEAHIGGEGEDVNNIKPSTAATPGRQRRGGQNGNNSKSVSMTFCLSPLVRASPKRSSHKKDGLQTGFSGEIRVSSSVHDDNLSTGASFCANRSRKIANFGRYNNP